MRSQAVARCSRGSSAAGSGVRVPERPSGRRLHGARSAIWSSRSVSTTRYRRAGASRRGVRPLPAAALHAVGPDAGAVARPAAAGFPTVRLEACRTAWCALQPELQHHQDPHQFAVVRGVTLAVQAQGLAQELRPEEAALRQRCQRVLGQAAQAFVSARPDAERQSEAVLGLVDDLVRQEAAAWRACRTSAAVRCAPSSRRGCAG